MPPRRGLAGSHALLLCVSASLLCASTVFAQPKSDHYKTLDVQRNADEKAIKKAYHKKALRFHPDKTPACKKDQKSALCKKATSFFMRISNAYEVLSDKARRKYYDETGQVRTKRAVVLLVGIAPPTIVEMLKKFKGSKEEEFMKQVKFGHMSTILPADTHKYKLRKLPAVLMSTKGDPATLRLFEGKLEADVLQKAIEILVRTKTAAPPKKEQVPVDMVSKVEDQAGLDACLGVKGVCVVALVHAGGQHPPPAKGRKPASKPPAVQHLERVAEKIAKAKAKRLKLAFVWIDIDRFPTFAQPFATFKPGADQEACVAAAAAGGEGGSSCRGDRQEPHVLAIIAKKVKFAGFHSALGKGVSTAKPQRKSQNSWTRH